MKTFADKAIEFYADLHIEKRLPAGVEVLNPYTDPGVQNIVASFFQKFYSDQEERIILLGINPGRFGAGITGITFTDPVRLDEDCGIPNSFDKRSELSSRFIYDMIGTYGGVDSFFSSFYLSAVCPFGFVKSGKNLNYYDDILLEGSLKDFIISSLKRQCEFGIRSDIAISIGEGKNFKYLEKLNREFGIFGKIVSVPHPRWVMQYRFKRKKEFIRTYIEVLNGESQG